MRLRPLAAAALVAVSATSLASCTRDRTQEANALHDDVLAMPGVTAVDMYYDNHWSSGYDVKLTVDMFTATPAQVDAVARRIDAAQAGALADYDPVGVLRVTRTSTLTFTEQSDTADIPLHTVATRLAEPLWGTVDARSAGDRVIDLGPAVTDSPTATVDALFRIVAVPFTVAVDSRRRDGTSWRIVEPTTAEVKAAVQSRIAALPTVPTAVRMNRDGIAELSLDLPDDAVAYDAIVSAARTTDGSKDRPTVVKWTLTGHPSPTSENGWRGSVTIGGCDDGSAQSATTDPFALDLERRIQTQFNVCAT
ncbi:hypothetical protein nbrc107696_46100 [Gordonia spumicola]|uniref:Lipoprotein n=1 Tax=Gordonia spumicola TaxID=589161 RepID=A0A7I9V473_9ACTN|nr:hypothetical protein [Gordonia spumicola]GEE00235.1 hypothetical protein nbrc107696_06810 [Gordonia spumicola]GEE04164.1 hypothetical protein nbrc107696_46100 [Gordonia spumicola]